MRRKTFAVAGVAVLTLASACGGAPEDEGVTTVTVGVLPIVDVAPLHLGVEQGFFEDHGLDLEIENTGGGAEAVPNVVSGEYDFAFGNITSLIIARDQDLPVKIVSNGVTSTGEESNDFGGVVVPEDSDISNPAELADKEVAVNTLQNIGDTTVRNSIRENGGDPGNVDFVELPFPDMPAALEKGQVDAAWVVEPFLTTAINDGAEEVTSNFVDAHEALSVASYFTNEQLIAEDPETAASFGAAMQESLAYADGRPEEVRRVLTGYTEMEEQLVEEIRLPNFPQEPDPESAEVIGELMVEDGLIDNEPDVDELFR